MSLPHIAYHTVSGRYYPSIWNHTAGLISLSLLLWDEGDNIAIETLFDFKFQDRDL